jgi:ubiquinone/menaquinone biosynthesis C-methylase UbiE
MESHLVEIREQQKETWNKFSPGWRKWDNLVMDALKPAGDEIINQLQLKGHEIVLDVASGTGEPGLTIASIVKNGKVIATDIAEGMLEIAREHAGIKGLKNFETQVCDVSELPFPDSTFDAISCRFGFMFFPDMERATKEMIRVLKPGGRIATSVWNIPEKNFWATVIMDAIHSLMALPEPPPGSPGLFRCAQPGFMMEMLKRAGFKNMQEVVVPGKLKCGTVEVYWNFMTDVAAPVVAALNQADAETKAAIKKEVFEKFIQEFPSDQVAIDSSALVISGEK